MEYPSSRPLATMTVTAGCPLLYDTRGTLTAFPGLGVRPDTVAVWVVRGVASATGEVMWETLAGVGAVMEGARAVQVPVIAGPARTPGTGTPHPPPAKVETWTRGRTEAYDSMPHQSPFVGMGVRVPLGGTPRPRPLHP